MTLTTHTVSAPGRASGVVVVSFARELRRVLAPDVHTLLWRRTPPEVVGDALDALLERHAFATHVDVTPDELESVGALTAFLPSSRAVGALTEDILGLARALAELTGARRLCASLATVSDDKCRKFHADYKAIRFVCTYVGRGTECVPDGAVRREALGRATEDMDAANRAIVPDRRRVLHARTWDVVVLKGESFPGNAERGAVHRSPPIEARGERRLVFKIDTDDVQTGACA